ncbi:hypothetical protein LNP26_00510 [Klebsiella variicola subsp. variicola]|nr:hypothetical protein [Klebsiella variicola subsp. variicola]
MAKNDALILDNTQTGLQHSDRLDVMGTGTIEIDDNRQLQLVTQYYKSQGDDDYGLWLGKNMSAVTSGGKAYTTDGLNSDRIPRYRAALNQPPVLRCRLLRPESGEPSILSR